MKSTRLLLVIFGLLALAVAMRVEAQDQERAREAYERAREHLDDQDFRRAADLFREVHEDHPDSEVAARALYWRAFALQRLGRTSDLDRAVELLNQRRERYRNDALSEEAERLRTQILGKLAKRGDSDAAREVHERAEGEIDQETRMMALNAILNMDPERAIPLLRRIVENRDQATTEMRAQAMFLLGQHFDEEAEELMLDALRNDPDEEVRGQAMFWLGQSAGERVIDVIEEVLADPSMHEVFESAIFALSQHDSERATQMLRNLAANDELDEEIRGNCIFWLGQRHDSYEFLAELYQDLEDDDLKEGVIFAMSQNGGPRQAEFLRKIFFDEGEDIELRNNALFWLSQTQEFGLSELEEIYDKVEMREMKEQVIFALSQYGGARAVEVLIKIARGEGDLELRRNAIFWLGQSGEQEALDFLEELVNQ